MPRHPDETRRADAERLRYSRSASRMTSERTNTIEIVDAFVAAGHAKADRMCSVMVSDSGTACVLLI